MNTALVTELGDDQVGKEIIEFMHKYNISTNYIDIYNSKDGKTPISLAFLDENNNANYTFYHQFPADRLNVVMPLINEGDIIIFGSYFSVNPVLRHRIIEILEFAKTRKAIVYYDPNFRKAHAHKAMMLMPSIIENLEYANIVRGSDEDFETLYKLNDPEKIYIDKIKFYCPNFIYTRGGQGIEFYCEQGHRHFDAPSIGKPISTIGAGDTFNAGILFGLIHEGVYYDDLATLPEATWDKVVSYAIRFSSEVCQSYQNYVSNEFAQSVK
jgi:fructokinase